MCTIKPVAVVNGEPLFDPDHITSFLEVGKVKDFAQGIKVNVNGKDKYYLTENGVYQLAFTLLGERLK